MTLPRTLGVIAVAFGLAAWADDAPPPRLPRGNLLIYRGPGGKFAQVKTAKDWATMAFQSVALVANEALDAGSVIRGSQDKPHVVVSLPFDASGAGTAAHGGRTLELAGPLVADLGHDSIPASAVTLRPDTLQPQQTTFELVVNGTGHPALGYSGKVFVIDAQGKHMETVDVWVST